MKDTLLKSRVNQLLCALAMGIAVPGVAFGAAAMTSADYKAAKDRAAADYKQAKAQCDTMSGNAKDVCVAEAKAHEKKAKAEAEAHYKNSDKAIRDARIAAAEADYDVAKTMSGNEKDVCIKDAKAAETRVKADAKANQKVAAVRNDAAEDKRDADYKAAVERCDSMSGAAKDKCVSDTKARFGK